MNINFSILQKYNRCSIKRNLIFALSVRLSNSYHSIPYDQSHYSRLKYPPTSITKHNNRLHSSKTKMVNDHTPTTLERIKEKKRQLRLSVRSELKQLSKEEINAQSSKVWKQLFQMNAYKQAKSIGLFISMPSGEIETKEALCHIIQDGKVLYVPRVGTNFEFNDMDMVLVVCEGPHFHEDFYKDWNKNKWGIPEPPQIDGTIAKPGDIDLLLVPGLAFDKDGGRLGQGKGYYDRFIEGNNREGKMDLIGVCLSPQFLDGGVPRLGHDCCMDVIISPDSILNFQK